LENGAPPHAGFALGLDRYIALLAEKGNSKASIRDVIAFPKTKEGNCLMMKSPARPPQELLDRYGIQVDTETS
jgi:aspartyl-tRNA synthetase